MLCLADDTEGTNQVFYILNEIDGSMNRMVNLATNQKIYTIIPTGADYAGPEGYTATTLEIGGENINAWIKEEGSEFYVVYAMNYNGETALYVYDKKEETMQRFAPGNKADGNVEEPSTDDSAVKSLQNKYTNLKKRYEDDKTTKIRIIIGLGAGCFILLLLCIILMFKANIIKEDDEETDEEDKILGGDSGQELKLDMVAQVNEMKAEKLAENINDVLEQQEDSADETTGQEEEEMQAGQPESNHTEVTRPEGPTGSEPSKARVPSKEQTKETEEEEPFEIEFVDLEDGDDR